MRASRVGGPKMVATTCGTNAPLPTALRLEEYDGEDDCAWLLLEEAAAA